MPKIKLEQRKAILITGVIILITLIIGLKIIYQPKQGKAIRLKAEIQEEMERNSLIKEIIALQNDIEGYQNKFSPQPQTVWLEEKLRRLIENLDIKLIEIKSEASGEISGFSQLTVELKLKSNYHKIGKLVSQLEKLPEFIEVKNIKIVSTSVEAWDRLISADPKTITTPRRHPQSVGQKEKQENSEIINLTELDTILNKSQEAQIILEVCTFYVR